MSTRSTGRHRRLNPPYQPVAAGQRDSMAVKAGVFATGTVMATAALIGAPQAGAALPALVAQAADVALMTTTTDPFNLQGLLDGITFGGVPLGSTPLITLLTDNPALNPSLGELLKLVGLDNGTTTNGLATTVDELLNFAKVGNISINTLLGDLLPGISGTSTVTDVLGAIDVPIAGHEIALGTVTVDQLLAMVPVASGDAPLSDATTLSTLLTDFPQLGSFTLPPIVLDVLGVHLSIGTPSLSNLVTDLGLGSTSLGSLLDFTSTTNIDGLATEFGIDKLTVDNFLSYLGDVPGTTTAFSGTSTVDNLADYFGVGSLTLGSLIPGGEALTNTSTLADLLGDTALFGTLGNDTIDQLLGLVPIA